MTYSTWPIAGLIAIVVIGLSVNYIKKQKRKPTVNELIHEIPSESGFFFLPPGTWNTTNLPFLRYTIFSQRLSFKQMLGETKTYVRNYDDLFFTGEKEAKELFSNIKSTFVDDGWTFFLYKKGTKSFVARISTTAVINCDNGKTSKEWFFRNERLEIELLDNSTYIPSSWGNHFLIPLSKS